MVVRGLLQVLVAKNGQSKLYIDLSLMRLTLEGRRLISFRFSHLISSFEFAAQ